MVQAFDARYDEHASQMDARVHCQWMALEHNSQGKRMKTRSSLKIIFLTSPRDEASWFVGSTEE
jgi:hypothetical protein